jgi:hypothetical protein
MLKFEWKESKGKFSSGETLYIKDYPLGGWSWDSCRPKDSDTFPYVIHSNIPLNLKIKHFKTSIGAKLALERHITYIINYFLDK